MMNGDLTNVASGSGEREREREEAVIAMLKVTKSFPTTSTEMIMWSVNYERQILHKSGIKLNTQFDASNLQDKEYKPAVTSS